MGGGGGGGGAAGDAAGDGGPPPKAFLAACIASDWDKFSLLNDGVTEGGGGVDLDDGAREEAVSGGGGGGAGGSGVDDKEIGGGRAAAEGGGGGAGTEGGVEAVVDDKGGAAVEGFLEATGGGGGLDRLRLASGARGGVTSAVDWARYGIPGAGRCPGFAGALRRFAPKRFAVCGGEDSEVGRPGLKEFKRGAVGGFGADAIGGPERNVSGSEIKDDSLSAPVSTPPPVFFSLGIPPAKIPPSWGAVVIFPPSPPVSLLLRVRLVDEVPGPDGATPARTFPVPGIAGAPARGGIDVEVVPLSTIGADRSLVTAFFSLVPFVMSPSKAP